MFKRISFIIVYAIIGLGLLFVGLDILDIAEDFRFNLPIPIFNTIFISLSAVIIACIAAEVFYHIKRIEVFMLGCAALTFGTGILFYGWFTLATLETRVAIYDLSFFMAAVLHLLGVTLSMKKTDIKIHNKRSYMLLVYLFFVAIIVLSSLLFYYQVVPIPAIPRDLVHGIGAAFCLIAAAIYLKTYIKSRSEFHYWYSLGLILFTAGILFMAQGALESRIAWLGRVSQYTGYIFLIISTLVIAPQAKIQRTKNPI